MFDEYRVDDGRACCAHEHRIAVWSRFGHDLRGDAAARANPQVRALAQWLDYDGMPQDGTPVSGDAATIGKAAALLPSRRAP